jgi:hypothetical protein
MERMNDFTANNIELLSLVAEWEPRLMTLPTETIESRRNSQSRNIKQIVGHMVDSASNNTHRLIHFQYQPDPMIFPDYAHLGNNDRWISIQNYETENWFDLIKLWRYTNQHLVHVIGNLNPEKLDHVWLTAIDTRVTMREMVEDYLPHFRLHLREIEDLISLK